MFAHFYDCDPYKAGVSRAFLKKKFFIFSLHFVIETLNHFTNKTKKKQIVAKHDQMVPHFVQDVVGHISGMPGLFISCVFSASLRYMEH